MKTKKENIEFLSNNSSNYIDEISKKTAWDELKALKGIEPIITQLEKIVTVLHKDKENKTQNKKFNKMRLHFVFKGSPGTGKTTVAKLFAKILQEEGVLSIGHFVDSNVYDLIEIGNTHYKSRKKCEEALGGVLFIDEAFGFIAGDINSIEMGKAFEVLIQFMKKEDFMLFIAGYENEIDNFFKGNEGLNRLFVKNLYFKFEEYPLNILYEILDLCIERSDKFYTERAKEIIKIIIEKRFNSKTVGWANAREVENLISEIELENAIADTIDVSNIPHTLIETIAKNRFFNNIY